jgi:hypothetical protein
VLARGFVLQARMMETMNGVKPARNAPIAADQ